MSRPQMRPRHLVVMLLGGIGFWSLIFWLAPNPWRLFNFFVASAVLIIVRTLINPTPKPKDPLDGL